MQSIQHRRRIHLAKLFAGPERDFAFTGYFLKTVQRGFQGDDILARAAS
jgi:hypothetical protein